MSTTLQNTISREIRDFRAFEATPGISVIVRADAPRYTLVAVSNDFIQASGMKREEVIGAGHFAVFPQNPDDPQFTGERNLRASFDYILQNKKNHQIPQQRYDIPNGDGGFRLKYWRVTNAPILDDEGGVAYIVHSVVDITGQVLAEQNLERRKEMEKAYSLFLKAPASLVIVKGEDHIIDFANEAILHTWGRTADVVGMPLLEALPELEQQGFGALFEGVRKGGTIHRAYGYPVAFVRGGREEVLYFDFVLQPYYEQEGDRTPAGVLGIAHDVTEQVHSRQQLKNIVALAPDPILILRGEDMVLEIANQALFELWQVGPEALHKPFLEILPEMKDQGFLDLLRTVLHTGEPFYGKEEPAVFQRAGGRYETRYLNFSYQPYREADGTISGVLVTATDVTGQVEARQKLQESERNLRNTILQSPVAMCIFRGPSFVVGVANERMLEHWGKKAKEVLARPIFEGLPEIKGQGLEELLQGVYTSGESFSAEERPVLLPREGGLRTVYVNFVYEPFREGDGTISGVIAVAYEVTAQVNARKKLEESAQQVRSLVESAPFPIGVYTGAEMRIRLANKSMIDVWGKGPGVVGKCYPDVLPELGNSEIFAQLEGVYTTGIPFHARNQRVDLVVDGQLGAFYFNYSFTPLHDAAGKVYGVMNTAAEITDLVTARQQVEQSERNFRNMVRQAPVAMCILLGPDHVVDIANDLMIRLWGKPAEEVMHKPIFEGLPDAREQGLEQLLAGVYQSGEPFTAHERPVELVRGGKRETVYQNFVYEPYRDSDGRTLGVLAISVDVTPQVLARRQIEEVVRQRTGELATANEALQRSNGELQRTNANLEEFAYAASHDMKEPIRKILFYADRLRLELQEQLKEGQSRLFERLEGAAQRMRTLIDDLLTYSQATKGLADQEVVCLDKTVQLVLEDLELEVQQKGAVLSLGALPVVQGNRRQLQQLFQNLISNALKYSQPGIAPHIQVSARKVRPSEVRPGIASGPDRWYHLIEVRDNGIGFEQKEAGRIFQVFTRLPNQGQYRGTGVGLSIVQKVAENHDGAVWAESEPGKGAVFTLLLPAG
ncbi:PAS domain-containing protein [Paraflavisolibacter sp. H34]|uniref:PAS domain-containing sensor histidine kinase n=1 Tax=Huijunlia imazamoxiresistens TaxID=3127457 RepID=UPI00301597F8